ncbi:MAG: right-handed parallel beta-helix repeat-containing protein [Chloroflexota bacterium]|nr:right-handed parallel beta-helix repeat-containing protein [Chloroflexota bacterium]
MFSATGLVAAFAVLALSVSVVNTDPAPPNAGAGTTHTVNADGTADFSTIQAAVDATSDGDTVLVQPGTYTEAITIDKDITLSGDGPVEEIVLHAPEDGPTAPTGFGPAGSSPERYAVLLVDTEAGLSGLTFQGEGAVVIASGGAPTLTGLVVDGVGVAYKGASRATGNSIVINGGSTATVQGNTLTDGGPIGVFDLSEPLIEGNTLSGGPHIWGGYGDGAIIRGNTIDAPLVRGIYLGSPSAPLIEGNVITNPGFDGIVLKDSSPTVRNNTISGASLAGINVKTMSGTPTIEGNELTDNDTGIILHASEAQVDGNTVKGGDTGVMVGSGSPMLTDNSVEGSRLGIVIRAFTSPTLNGNTLCAGEANVRVSDGVDVDLGGNEMCEGVAA